MGVLYSFKYGSPYARPVGSNHILPIKEKLRLTMMGALCRVDAIQMVWSAVADGYWHSRLSIIDRIPALESAEVISVLDFFVKYGFAESSIAGEERLRLITDGPSPIEAAGLLRIVGLETDSPLSGSNE
jgi:hypothetical protein